MAIRPLPPLLVNQIAAGEVIERPASVVKELIENAIDAGARRIVCVIESGGRDLIRVSDDGSGIALGELALAVAPHATSKIASIEDLGAIATMGFRGEALASIASVSRLSLLSRPPGQAEAGLIEVEGERVSGPRPAAGAVGTTVTVANLFFNTPARRKFLKSDQTEAGRVTEVLETLAMSHPAIGFTLSLSGRLRVDLPPGQPARERAIAIIGSEMSRELLELDERGGPVGLWGLLGRPDVARTSARHVRLYLNGRPISDRTLLHAVREAYRGLIAPDRTPTAVLMLEVDPLQVDVNVHPAKAEVRFRESQVVHRAVLDAVRGVLARADLVPVVDLRRAGAPGAAVHVEEKFVPRGSGGGGAAGSAVGGAAAAGPRGFDYAEVASILREPPLAAPPGPLAAPPAARATRAIVVRDCYIVTEDDEGLLIVDQHALHERVMFERLKARIADSGALESQRLLVPAVVEIERGGFEEALESLRPLLERLGIEAEAIGPRALAVHAYTTLLFERNVDPASFLRELLDNAGRYASAADSEAALHEVLDMMACKAAVKAGDRLAPEELSALLEARARVERSSRCPHGRPTALRLTIADLDRQFGRA